PDLTAERFIPDPFGPRAGGRLYRTGDLARWLPDGRIAFLGRTDLQVKIRGFRIEPAEIEAVLASHPDVRQAAVAALAGPGGADDRRLAAYVVSAPGRGIDGPGLLRFLAERVPDFMMPAALMALPALPLSPNGKVDRRALPAPASWGVAVEIYVAPRTPLEELLCGLWSELLGTGRIGVHDEFFAFGGHSLLAARLMSRLQASFGVTLPLRALFEAPTVAGLAARIDEERRGGGGIGLIGAPPVTRWAAGGEPPLSFAQERLWFLDQLEPGSPVYNIPAAVQLAGELAVPAFVAALAEVVRRHESLRTTFAAENGRPRPVTAAPAIPAVPIVDLSVLGAEERDDEVRRLALDEARRPFDLGTGPLLRAVLLRLETRRHTAVVTMHHIVSDGWSMGVFVGELAALYGAFAAGRPSPLPELPVQYGDFARWQTSWLRGAVLEEQLDYWRRRLADPPVLTLPADRPRPVVQSLCGARLRAEIPSGLARDLTALGHAMGATPFMVLLTGFGLLLSRYAGQPDLVIGTPIANRNRPEIEGLIGFFVNTLALRLELPSEQPARRLLAATRETLLDAYAHQDLPFEKLVEALSPERSLAQAPLFQVFFAFQNAPFPVRELPGLSLTATEVDNGTAKFDLGLMLREEGSGFAGSFEYATDLFDRSTVERLAGHLGTLLSAMVSDPERAVGELPLLTTAERDQLLVEWSSTAAASPIGCLHELFAAQAERTPEATALVFQGSETSYGELERRSRRLARRLRALGVGPEVRVGVCLERTPDLVVALLGV
ncbi:MAG TPA: condensation domain-containing protein, partial [Thermoanaerobaculia bacterium]|nr:condensation domain-containing protein [Thermoanaerobaculia bacterium]